MTKDLLTWWARPSVSTAVCVCTSSGPLPEEAKEQLAERLKHYMASVHVYNETGEDMLLKGFDVDKALEL